jgi:hypothetical protein
MDQPARTSHRQRENVRDGRRLAPSPDPRAWHEPDAPGWVAGAPPLAVEYADTGQDEADLAVKIRELFAAGTRLIWVARLVGPRRVEVHRPDAPMQVYGQGDLLEAPGILRNPVLVEALFDQDAAYDATLVNLLQRRGYAGLDAVRTEGERIGEFAALREAIVQVLDSRGVAPDAGTRGRIAECCDLDLLKGWLRRAAVVPAAGSLFDPPV